MNILINVYTFNFIFNRINNFKYEYEFEIQESVS